MSKSCKFVSKKDILEYKKEFISIVDDVRKDIKEEYEKGVSISMVGSSKRNLVIQKGESSWDIDYQIMFNSNVFDDVDPTELKVFVKEKFEKHFGSNYSIKIDKSIIKICLIHVIDNHALKSFDVALIKNTKNDGNKKILRTYNRKSDWEDLQENKDWSINVKQIKGSDMWGKLREIFLRKKCDDLNKEEINRKDTVSIYLESVKETIDLF